MAIKQCEKSTDLAAEISEEMAEAKTVAKVNKIFMAAQKNKDLTQEDKEWLNGEAEGNRIKLRQWSRFFRQALYSI